MRQEGQERGYGMKYEPKGYELFANMSVYCWGRRDQVDEAHEKFSEFELELVHFLHEHSCDVMVFAVVEEPDYDTRVEFDGRPG